jgi:hypothetical protein
MSREDRDRVATREQGANQGSSYKPGSAGYDDSHLVLGHKPSGDGVFQIGLEDGCAIDRPLYRAHALRQDPTATAWALEVSRLVDDQLIALMDGKKHQCVGASSALAFHVSDIISAGQTAQLSVDDHAPTPLPD